MTDYYKKNTSILIRRTPATASLPKRLSNRITVQTANSGCPTIKYGSHLIHSSYDPVKEGQAFGKNLPAGSSVCLYGYGLGYHLESILEKIGPDGSLLVIELNTALLAAAMILRDQSKVLSDPRFHLIYGEDEQQVAREISNWMTRIEGTANAHMEVLFHHPSFKCIPDGFPRLANSLEILLMERRFPAVLGDIEVDNFSHNQNTVLQSAGINTLSGAHRSRPGLLISAGPSLDDVLPYLKRISDSAILGCVDTALPILTRENIVPDYIFSLDPQDESFNHFRDNLNLPATLVFTPTANARMVHFYQGRKIVVFKEGHTLLRDQSQLAREKGFTRAGGSVSCLGLDSLLRFGCDPVILIGQDCAYTGHRIYSRYSDQNSQLMDKLNRAHTLHLKHQEKAGENKQVLVPSDGGGEVLTSQSMYSYLRTLEQIAESYPEAVVYNLCSHGAQIERVKAMGSVNELLNILNVPASISQTS